MPTCDSERLISEQSFWTYQYFYSCNLIHQPLLFIFPASLFKPLKITVLISSPLVFLYLSKPLPIYIYHAISLSIICRWCYGFSLIDPLSSISVVILSVIRLQCDSRIIYVMVQDLIFSLLCLNSQPACKYVSWSLENFTSD